MPRTRAARPLLIMQPYVRLAAVVLAAAIAIYAQGVTETALLRFGDFPNGANPYAPLTLAARGNLYGTTSQGGSTDMGVVFVLTPSGKFKVLHSFEGGNDGANPYSGVALDSAGNLYGTTYAGGASGAGVVYKLDPSGQETVLYSFTGGNDGANPYSGVVLDSTGNLYGTTYNGGALKAGVVYKVSLSGQETVLYTFTGGTDGGNPYAGVIFGPSGNLYGTTMNGGAAGYYAAGALYELSPAGQEAVLYSFAFANSGTVCYPYGGVIFDSDGNLYGTGSAGGQWGGGGVYKLDAAGSFTVLFNLATAKGPGKPEAGLAMDSEGNLYGTAQVSSNGMGGVFKLDAQGNLKSLYSFPGASRPQSNPEGASGGVVLDSAGNIYGATAYGGVSGMVYKLAPSGRESTLYSFAGAAGGTEPQAGIFRDSTGVLYGTTVAGGPANFGTVYKVDASGQETPMYSFTGGADGAHPGSSPVADAAGNVYGTTAGGGTAGFGVVYKLDTSGEETVLHTFTGGGDGGYPGPLIMDAEGSLYGTAWYGASGGGVVYKIDPAGEQTVLYSFTGGADGGSPNCLILDQMGNLYGTAGGGGASGYGAVFKLDQSGNETVLYSFAGGPAGAGPVGVIRDAAGNLFGATSSGGVDEPGWGVLFELSSEGRYAVLYSFVGGTGGGTPVGAPARDSAGDLYGATIFGGASDCWGGSSGGCGVVYKVDPSGQETVLHAFTGGADGASPYAGPVIDAAGTLYGTTPWGGKGGLASLSFSGGGVLYKITQ